MFGTPIATRAGARAGSQITDERYHEILRDWRDDLRTGRAFQGKPEVFPSLSSGHSDGAVERRAPAPSAFYTQRGRA